MSDRDEIVAELSMKSTVSRRRPLVLCKNLVRRSLATISFARLLYASVKSSNSGDFIVAFALRSTVLKITNSDLIVTLTELGAAVGVESVGAPEGARVGSSNGAEVDGAKVAGTVVGGAMVGSSTGAGEVGAEVDGGEVGAEVDGGTVGASTGGAVGDKACSILSSVSSHTIVKFSICASLAFWPALEPEMSIPFLSGSLHVKKFCFNGFERLTKLNPENSPPDTVLTKETYSF
jgi:hypothetical protein